MLDFDLLNYILSGNVKNVGTEHGIYPVCLLNDFRKYGISLCKFDVCCSCIITKGRHSPKRSSVVLSSKVVSS